MMKKKILAGLAALVVIAGFSAFAATPAALEGSSSGTYGPGYTCYDNGNGYCRGPRACYDDHDNCYTGNGHCQGPRRGCRADGQRGCQGRQDCPAYSEQQ